MVLVLYMAKFSLLAVLYVGVFVAYSLAYGFRASAKSVGQTVSFVDSAPGRLWVVPISGLDEITDPAAIPCKDPVLIGRAEHCDFTLKSPFSSELHARVSPRENGCDLEDLHTANGTLCDSRPVNGKVRIEEGSCFTIGNVSFRLERRADLG